MLTFPILASHAYEPNTLISTTKIPIGTGKYKILNITNDKIKLAKSSENTNSKINKINILLKENYKNLYNGLTNKEIDLIITDNVNYEEYIGTMGYNVNSSSGREFDYLIFNTEDNILKLKEVRQAISFAIDKNAINYYIYKGKYNLAEFPLGYRKLFI